MTDLVPLLTFSIGTARLELAVDGITCEVFGINETSLYKITVNWDRHPPSAPGLAPQAQTSATTVRYEFALS
jgi:hypothetical protein